MIKLHDDYFTTRFTIEFEHGGEFEIDASCLQDAIDILIDHLSPYEGYFLTDEEITEYEKEGYLENYIYGGNYCQYLSFQWYEIHVTEVYR